MKHIMICGEIGVGKSTLISRLLENTARPVCGYITKSLNVRDDGYHEIFMYAPGDEEHAVFLADCNRRSRHVNLEVFETLGVELLSDIRSDGIIVMDEIGFMEERAEHFTSRVLELLDGSVPVIGAVKSTHPDSAYLNSIRNHPNVELVYINQENRDDLYYSLLERVKNL